ncbi:MAG: translation initiation factor IF-2 [Breznakibacter sp.]|nr:translation initiation factor IF-2 [Breznakibacter sp.]
MSGEKLNKLSKVARDFNVGMHTIQEFLHKKGMDIKLDPNARITDEMYTHLEKEYRNDLTVKKESMQLNHNKAKEKKESVSIEHYEATHTSVEKAAPKEISAEKPTLSGPKVVGKVDLNPPKPQPVAEPVVAPVVTPEPKAVEPVAEKPVEKIEKPEVKAVEHIETKVDKLENNLKVVDKIDLNSLNMKTRPDRVERETSSNRETVKSEPVKVPTQEVIPEGAKAEPVKDELFRAHQAKVLSGPTVVGKIDLPVETPKGTSVSDAQKARKKKRKRIKKEKERVAITDKGAATGTPASTTPGAPRPATTPGAGQQNRPYNQNNPNNQNRNNTPRPGGGGPNQRTPAPAVIRKRPEVSEVDVQKQIKDTLARLTSKGGKTKASRHRKDKRELFSQKQQEEAERSEIEKSILRVTEFVTVAELASLIDVKVTDIISACMSLGLFVSINQRLDAETLLVVAGEFGYKVEFISVDAAETIEEEDAADDEASLLPRSPIVTVMGHVDHGKTSLLDYIRKANVIAGEAGGITQHIGAYSVKLENGRTITFLDTPGHEAFTAMRARGAQVTDIAIIIVAADDNVMPQTVEAINHASAAGVPIIFAINKIDKPGADPDKVRNSLAQMNYLVEEWGGKYQSQAISAKSGLNVQDLLDKILLEADILDLKANPNKRASGSVIESSLDKGRGYVSTLLVQSGTLRVGDMILSGSNYGNVKAMFNERGQKVTKAEPSEPVLILGLNGAPQAGERFNVVERESEAREIATKRMQLQREQGMRTKKHVTLDEIGRRIAIGNFQELNVIVKGDVDGSIEALSDSLLRLSTAEIKVNVIHKAVGQISESDIMLAAASNAIVIGFQVRPALAARRLAEKEQIDIRLYSIIYDAIEEVKSAMEGMLSPEIKEQIISTLEVLEAFTITKVGTVAGCIVRDGKIKRNSKIRIIRDGIVIHTGDLGSLKRFKDDVKEVANGYECGLNIHNYNDIKVGDMIEAFEQTEVSRKL